MKTDTNLMEYTFKCVYGKQSPENCSQNILHLSDILIGYTYKIINTDEQHNNETILSIAEYRDNPVLGIRLNNFMLLQVPNSFLDMHRSVEV